MPTILIADDEKAIRKSLRDILEYEKYTVDEVMMMSLNTKLQE